MKYLHLFICDECGHEKRVYNTSANAPKYCSPECRKKGSARKRAANKAIDGYFAAFYPYEPDGDQQALECVGE